MTPFDLLNGAGTGVVVAPFEGLAEEYPLGLEEPVEDALERLAATMRVLLAEQREEVVLDLLTTRTLRVPLRGLGPLRIAVTLQLPLTLVPHAGEAVLLVDQLRDSGDRAAGLHLAVRVPRREVVELRHPLEHLAPRAEPRIAALVQVREDLARDVVLAEFGLRVDAPVDAREERAIDATSAKEHDDIVLPACEQRHRVHDGIEHVGRVVERKVRRHGSLSTSRARSSTRRGRHDHAAPLTGVHPH